MARRKTDNFIRWIRLNNVQLENVTRITLKVPVKNCTAMTAWKKTHAPMFRYHNPKVTIKVERSKQLQRQTLTVRTKDGKKHAIVGAENTIRDNRFKSENDQPAHHISRFIDAHHITRSILAIETGQPLAQQLYAEDPEAKDTTEDSALARVRCCVSGEMLLPEHVEPHPTYEGFFRHTGPSVKMETKGTGAAWATTESPEVPVASTGATEEASEKAE